MQWLTFTLGSQGQSFLPLLYYYFYTFVILPLQLLNGKKPDDFVHAAFDLSCPLQEYLEELSELKRFNDVMVDSIIMEDNSFPGKEQQFHVFKQLILKCIDVSPEDRPTIAYLTKQLRQMHRS